MPDCPDELEYKLRFDYPLTTRSMVWDIGAHTGYFAAGIWTRYQPQIMAFEPVNQFYCELLQNVGKHVHCLNYGIGGYTRDEYFQLYRDATGLFCERGDKIKCYIVGISGIMACDIDLMKINIEGMEYELLEKMIELEYQKRVKNIQVQFHNSFPEARDRMEKIQKELSKTHELTYQYEFDWENWKLK